MSKIPFSDWFRKQVWSASSVASITSCMPRGSLLGGLCSYADHDEQLVSLSGCFGGKVFPHPDIRKACRRMHIDRLLLGIGPSRW